MYICSLLPVYHLHCWVGFFFTCTFHHFWELLTIISYHDPLWRKNINECICLQACYLAISEVPVQGIHCCIWLLMNQIKEDGEDEVHLPYCFLFKKNIDSSVVCHSLDYRSKTVFEFAKRLSRSCLTH